jgi:hypothetical protein
MRMAKIWRMSKTYCPIPGKVFAFSTSRLKRFELLQHDLQQGLWYTHEGESIMLQAVNTEVYAAAIRLLIPLY